MARFQETVDIQPQSTRSFSEQTIQSIVQRVENFNAMQQQLRSGIIAELQQKAVQRGLESAGKYQLSVNEYGFTQPPEYKKERFIGGIEVQAHNKALKEIYIRSLESDIREGVEIAAERHFDDVPKFNNAAISFATALLDNVDPAVKGIASQELDRQITNKRIEVQATAIRKDHEYARMKLAAEAEKLEDSAILNALNGDITNGIIDFYKLSDLTQKRVEANHINQAQADALLHKYEINYRTALFEKNLADFTKSGKFDKAVSFIDETRNNIPMGYTKEDHDNLINILLHDLNQSLAFKDKEEKEKDKLDKQLRREQQRNIQLNIITGKKDKSGNYRPYTTEQLRKDIENSVLTNDEINELMNIHTRRGRGINDWDVITRISDDIYNDADPELIERYIRSNMGFNLTDETALDLLNQLRERQDKESILWTSRVIRARDYVEGSYRLSPMEKRFKAEETFKTIRIFNERVKAKEDAWKVADELFIKNNFEKLPSPILGDERLDKNDLETAQKRLEEAALIGEITKEDYNIQIKRIRALREAQQQLIDFEKAKKANALPKQP